MWLLGVPAVAVVLALTAPGRLWPDEPRRTGALRILGAGLLAVLMVVPLFLYNFAITVSAALCGRTGWPEVLGGAVPFVVILTWGLRGRRRIVFAFPAAVLAADACALLAAYADTAAHAYCETLSSYVASV